MNRVVPTIFALDVNTLKKKFELLSFSSMIHLDICDGDFVSTKTVDLHESVSYRKKNQEIEVHLMVKAPLDYLEQCSKLKVKGVYVQREIFNSLDEFLLIRNAFTKKDIDVYLVFNPDTLIGESISYLSYVKKVMLMSVFPGAEGQEFIESVLSKVRELKLLNEKILVQIDGGINDKTGRLALASGVDFLSVGSFISSSENPKKNFDLLNQL